MRSEADAPHSAGVWSRGNGRAGGAVGLPSPEELLGLGHLGSASFSSAAGPLQAGFIIAQLGAESRHVLLGATLPPEEATFAVGTLSQQRLDRLVRRLVRHTPSPSALVGSSDSSSRSDPRRVGKDTPAIVCGSVHS